MSEVSQNKIRPSKIFWSRLKIIGRVCAHSTIVLLLLQSCVEPYEFSIPNTKSLVIQGLLTNEVKQHQVLLSRAYRFEDGSTALEKGANVQIIDEMGNEYTFEEVEDGRYVSSSSFGAQLGVGYSLVINTQDGKTYRSSQEEFGSVAEVSDVLAERGPNSFGEDGVSIYMDAGGLSGNSRFLRYEYEETYKIVAPQYLNLDFKMENYDPCEHPDTYGFEVVVRKEQQQICFGTRNSDEIIQINTSNQGENSIEKQLLRFVSADDYILSHRYSILVKQYVQSVNAFAYYKALHDFSSSESVFTDVQPGFLNGNIASENDAGEKVIGFFEVASVSTKRLFFNYKDFFPEEPLPDYPFKCNSLTRPPLTQPLLCLTAPSACYERSLFELVDSGKVAYWSEAEDLGCIGPYIVVPRGCGDCTLLGSNETPEFWTE